jgi:mono/diheme cytochrome c family protein/glucose/arabinose dehydrogenase
MKSTNATFRAGWLILAGTVGVWATGLSPFAQTQGTGGQTPTALPPPATPAGQAGPPSQPSAASAGQAAQGGRGRGFVEAPAADDPLNANADLSPKPPVLPLTPAEQAKRFWLPPGYRLEPVLADPVIDSPGQIAFDGNGRMFIAELRGYVQTLDGIDLVPPVGRISLHEDRDNDGVYEHHSVFVDKIVFPRFIMPFANSILTMETHNDEVWKYTDTNADGVADKKELFTPNFGRPGNIEHQPSSLFWAMDNWMYSTYNSFRMRWTPTGLLREPTGANAAQWGISQDNEGKVWFQGGASGMPGYFQFPIHYGNFDIPDRFEPNLNITWGAPILIGDIQAGLPGTRIPDGSLIRATASAGSEVYRGDRLPKDLVGDYLYGEVVARSVRRFKAVKTEGLTQLRNAHPLSEFIRSLDPLFRPVDVAGAPDGTIYIADMYRGIIEGAPWAKAGTYLRQKINQYELDKILGRGRIWRLTYDGIERDRTQPRMLSETPAQLVAHLSHPNGWWRDTAQQLIVLKQDTSVVPALEQLVRTSGNQLARFHALWTLEGLRALDVALVREGMKAPSPQMRIQAIRASESLYKAGDRSLLADYRNATRDADTDVVIQAMLTLNLFKAPDLNATIQAAQAGNRARGVQHVGGMILKPASTLTGGGRGRGWTADQQTLLQRGETIYKELCFTCHGPDGRGERAEGDASPKAPSLVGSPRVQGHRDYMIKSILHGMTGPIDGKTYSQVMVPMGANRDEWIAAVGSYLRNAFGNSGSLIAPSDVAAVRAATASRTTPWTMEELDASVPKPLLADATWKATASHNTESAAGGLNYLGWTSASPQQAGMWFQVELPAPIALTEMDFTSPTQGGGRSGPPPVGTFPRGYQVQVSMDGRKWSAPVAEGKGEGTATVITFAPVRLKFVRITQTGSVTDAAPWTIQRLRLYQAAAKPAGTR